AVRLFSRTGRKLRIAGQGPELDALRRIAGRNIEFGGRVSAGEARGLYARCRAFLMPGEEDFGITAVEALASGKAVIALGRGGAWESAPPGDLLVCILYPEATEDQLLEAIKRFERVESRIAPTELQASVA